MVSKNLNHESFVSVAWAEDIGLALEYGKYLEIEHIPFHAKKIRKNSHYNASIQVPVRFYKQAYDILTMRKMNEDESAFLFIPYESHDQTTSKNDPNQAA